MLPHHPTLVKPDPSALAALGDVATPKRLAYAEPAPGGAVLHLTCEGLFQGGLRDGCICGRVSTADQATSLWIVVLTVEITEAASHAGSPIAPFPPRTLARQLSGTPG